MFFQVCRDPSVSCDFPFEQWVTDGNVVAWILVAGIAVTLRAFFRFIMDDIALGVAIGTGVGIALGAGFSATKRPK